MLLELGYAEPEIVLAKAWRTGFSFSFFEYV
jgi:hypothetical protein